jgi:hypothetical protein
MIRCAYFEADLPTEIDKLIVDHALHHIEWWGERHVAFSACPARLGECENRSQGFKFLLHHFLPSLLPHCRDRP